MSEKIEHQVNLLDFLAFLVRWRRFLLTAVITFAIAATIVSFIVPKKYRSTAIIRAAERSSDNGVGALLGSKLGALGGMAGFMSGLGQAEGDFFISILKSRWMSERLIEEFELRRVYRMEKAPLEDVIEVVNTRTRFELEPNALAVQILADDNDPKRAQAMAEFLVDQVDQRYQGLRSQSAKRERVFVEQRLRESESVLRSLEDSLTRFQQTTGIINPEEQVRATIQAAALLEAERLATKSEIELKDMILGPGSSEANYLRLRLASIDSTMNSLVGRRSDSRTGDFLLNLADVPAQGIIYLRLMRDIEIRQILVGFLIQRYEQARIEEHRNTPSILQVDPPVIPTVRIWPRRGLMVGIATLAALILSIAIAAVIDFFSRAARDQLHPQHARIRMIRESWKAKNG